MQNDLQNYLDNLPEYLLTTLKIHAAYAGIDPFQQERIILEDIRSRSQEYYSRFIDYFDKATKCYNSAGSVATDEYVRMVSERDAAYEELLKETRIQQQ